MVAFTTYLYYTFLHSEYAARALALNCKNRERPSTEECASAEAAPNPKPSTQGKASNTPGKSATD